MYSTPPTPNFNQPYGYNPPPNGVPPIQLYRMELLREKKRIRRTANRWYAVMILALAAVVAGAALFSLPAYLADWLHGTARAALVLRYGWGVVVTQVLPALLGELLLLLFIRRRVQGGARGQSEPPASAGKRAGLCALGSLAAAGGGIIGALAALLAAAPLSLLGIRLPAGGIPIPTQTGPRVAVLLFALVVSPILEELIFRGMLFRDLCRFGERFAIVSSALMFAFFHFRFGGLAASLLVGLAMGCLALRVERIELVAGARVLSGVLIELVRRLPLGGSGGRTAPLWLLIPMIVSAAAVGILFVVFIIRGLAAAGDGAQGEAPLLRTGQRVGASLSGVCAVLGIVACVLLNGLYLLGGLVEGLFRGG